MAYEGTNLFQCLGKPYPWNLAYVVVVSGARWNPCGHAILNAGGIGGHYFHVAGDGYDKPYYMNESGYRRYLRESRKRELSRQYVPLKRPRGAQHKIDEITSKPWLWGVLPHNCASFVEEVLSAGGADVGVLSNCPALESWG